MSENKSIFTQQATTGVAVEEDIEEAITDIEASEEPAKVGETAEELED